MEYPLESALSSKSATDLNQGNTREIKFRLDGLNFSESFIEAQSMVNQSMDSVSSSENWILQDMEIFLEQEAQFLLGGLV